MTEDNQEDSLRFEREMGVNYGGEQMDAKEVRNTSEFQVETDAVFKRLAEDIYKSREASIRELITNSVTSVLRAESEGYIEDAAEGMIVIQLYEEGDNLRLTLRDNGIGITRSDIDEVVTQIGISTSRSSTELTGKFGMGFLATWMLAGGANGGFSMYSNPRGVGEGPFFGFWDNNGFSEMSPPKNSVAGLAEDEFGVEFEIFVDKSIQKEELVRWIDKYSEWTRVPVLFRHHTENDVKDEEYPIKSLTDRYEDFASDNVDKDASDVGTLARGADKLKYYMIDKEAFVAVNSNLKVSGSRYTYSNMKNCILLDVPIDIDSIGMRGFPLNSLEIRLHHETPIVVEGPNEGMFVVESDETPQELGEKFISEERLNSGDIVTPTPTGTRDTIQDKYGFFEWLSSEFKSIYYNDIADIVKSVDNFDDYCSLTDQERHEFHDIIKEISISYSVRLDDVREIEDLIDTRFDGKFRRAIPLFQSEHISVAKKGNKGVSRKENRVNLETSDIFRSNYRDDSEVFMAHRIKQERAEFVWASEKDHTVVRVASGKQQKYEELFGWKKLNELDFEKDLQFDENDRSRFTSENSTDVKQSKVTLHIGRYSNTKSFTAQNLREKVSNQDLIEDNNGNEHEIKKLILFNRTDDNISHNKDIVGSHIGTVSVKDSVYSYILQGDNVWTTDKIKNKYLVTLSDGTSIDLLSDSFPENSVYHVVDSETAKTFRDEDVAQKIESWIQNRDNLPNDAVYVPITPVEKNIHGLTIGFRNWSINTQYSDSRHKVLPADSDVELYSKAVLELEDDKLRNAIETVGANWSEGGEKLINLVKESNITSQA